MNKRDIIEIILLCVAIGLFIYVIYGSLTL